MAAPRLRYLRCTRRAVLLVDPGALAQEPFGEVEVAPLPMQDSLPPEAAASRVLLGLLLAERGDSARAVRLLQAGRAALDAQEWPSLAVQSRLVLAREWARLV